MKPDVAAAPRRVSRLTLGFGWDFAIHTGVVRYLHAELVRPFALVGTVACERRTNWAGVARPRVDADVVDDQAPEVEERLTGVTTDSADAAKRGRALSVPSDSAGLASELGRLDANRPAGVGAVRPIETFQGVAVEVAGSEP